MIRSTPLHIATMLTASMPTQALSFAALQVGALPIKKQIPEAGPAIVEELGEDWFARRPGESRQVWRARTR